MRMARRREYDLARFRMAQDIPLKSRPGRVSGRLAASAHMPHCPRSRHAVQRRIRAPSASAHLQSEWRTASESRQSRATAGTRPGSAACWTGEVTAPTSLIGNLPRFRNAALLRPGAASRRRPEMSDEASSKFSPNERGGWILDTKFASGGGFCLRGVGWHGSDTATRLVGV